MRAGDADARREGARIELQLDTAQLLLVIAALVALCGSSFLLGRWMERDRWKESAAAAPARSGALQEADAAGDLTFFDTLAEGQAEPHRQVAAPGGTGSDPGGSSARRDARPGPGSSPASPPAPASRTASEKPESGGYAVQVFAGDRTQAEKLAAALSGRGYAAKLVPGTGGARTARVRVVGYATREAAEGGAKKLAREEKLSPWVLKAD